MDMAPTDTPEPTRLDACLGMFQRLADMAMDLATRVHGEAMQNPQGILGAERDPTVVFARVARVVRLTVALEMRLAAEDARKAHAQELSDLQIVCDEWQARAREGAMRRKEMVGGLVAQAIDRAGGVNRHRQKEQLAERLEVEDDEDDLRFLTEPIGVLIAELSQSLGVTPDWSLWTRHPWALDEAWDEIPGSPYAAAGARAKAACAGRPPPEVDVGEGDDPPDPPPPPD